MTWQSFVLTQGWRIPKHHLAQILGQPEDAIERVRKSGAMTRRGPGTIKRYAELFALWHGRAPTDSEYPAPRRSGGAYEWFLPETTLLASLVGRLSTVEIADVLTARLRELTGVASAVRSKAAVQAQMDAIGMQTTDVVGGLTVQQAGAEIGSEAIVYQAINNRRLTPTRVGRLWVIPHQQWADWKASRVPVPEGFVRLASLRQQLGIRSDKLPEFAGLGYIPTAIRCNPMGAQGHSTKFGTWYVDAKVARKLVADRHAGRPMPWHGKPNPSNLKSTWSVLQARRHPDHCETCRQIWGPVGAPTEFDDYVQRYPPLAHGAKRHLTMRWHPGWTIAEVARDCGVCVSHVRRAIASGTLAATEHDGVTHITRTDATRWKTRKCPTGDGRRSWITLKTAKADYGFSFTELHGFIAAGELQSKSGSPATRGAQVVCRQQLAQLRERLGFTEGEAVKRVGVSLAKFRELLDGVRWRAAPRIPLSTVQAVIKRLESQQGMTVPEAAKHLRRSEQWVTERIEDGTVRVTRARWDSRRLYLTTPMIERLRAWRKPKVETITGHWLAVGEAAKLAGVSTSGIGVWHQEGTLKRRKTRAGYRYHWRSVQARARRYWVAPRNLRATPPAWFVAEQQMQTR